MRVLLPILVLSTLVETTFDYLSPFLAIAAFIVIGFGISWGSILEWRAGSSLKSTLNGSHSRAASIVSADRLSGVAGAMGDQPLTVLVVDDDQMVSNTCCCMLRAIGINCMSARDGREAIDIAAAQGRLLDLVILDLMMPGLPSNRIVKELWARDPALPVIIATGWDRSRIHPEILRSPNVRRVLYKPYDLQALRAACELSRVRSGRKIA
jgi:CheY-like chemotaxis protein